MDTEIGLEGVVRKQVAQHLGLLLADCYILYTKTQNFHWNLIDPRFYSIHVFLQKQYEELAEGIDELAERIRMLGEIAPGSLKQFLEMTSLSESDGILSGKAMISELLKDHESITRFLRERIRLISELADEGTADLLIKRIAFHEKSAWMLRSQNK